MRFPMAVTLAFSLLACASTTSSKTDKAKDPTLASNAGGPNAKGKYTCTYEEDTGSHMRQKICRYVEDSSVARDRTQQDMRDLSQQGMGNMGTSGR
jgi:hypothetical protein